MDKQSTSPNSQSTTTNQSENGKNIVEAKALASMFFQTHVKDVETKSGFLRTITLVSKPDAKEVELTLEEFHKMMKFLSGPRL
jgi:hypothetical protein